MKNQADQTKFVAICMQNDLIQGQRSFAYRGVHIWNNLDKNLKDCSSLKILKVALKKHLLAKDNI
jgi:hypothetical protein